MKEGKNNEDVCLKNTYLHSHPNQTTLAALAKTALLNGERNSNY